MFKVSRQFMRRFGLLEPATRTGNLLKLLKNFMESNLRLLHPPEVGTARLVRETKITSLIGDCIAT